MLRVLNKANSLKKALGAGPEPGERAAVPEIRNFEIIRIITHGVIMCFQNNSNNYAKIKLLKSWPAICIVFNKNIYSTQVFPDTTTA